MAPAPAMADSIFPLITIFSHIGLSIGLSALIYHSLSISRKVLPPSSGVRNRAHLRDDHLKLLTGLAVTSLLLASYFTVSYASHSYMLWAYSHRHSFRKHYPPLLFGFHGAFGKKEMYHWIAESPIYTSLLHIPVLTNRNYWWASALDLSAVPWALFLSIVGQRRKIQHLWAYAALSQLVGLSYAQALFFIALLLTPVPLPDNAREMSNQPRVMTRLAKLRKRAKNKPENWCPSPLVYLGSIGLSYLAVFLTPIAHDTTTFIPVTILSRILPFAPLALPYLVPESWGTVHPHPHARSSRYTNLFRLTSLISFILYAKATSYAIIYNDPGTHHHPTLLHPLHMEDINTLERTSTTINRILSAAFSSRGTNPLMGKIGWDVLLSGLTIGVWAMIRGTEPTDILRNMGVMGIDSHAELGDMDGVMDSVKDLADEAVGAITSAKKSAEGKIADKVDRELHRDLRRSGRGRKSVTQAAAESPELAVAPDTTKKSYAAAVKEERTPSSGRRRTAGDSETAKKRKDRGSRTMTEREDEKAYIPDNDEDVVIGEEDAELETESAALAWGLSALAGLGAVTSGVLGAESVRG